MQRTVKLQLNIESPLQADILKETLANFTAAFNFVAAYGWQTNNFKGIELHRATYYHLKEMLQTLPSQLICAARVKATEALKSAAALVKLSPQKLKQFEAKKAKVLAKGKTFERRPPQPPSQPKSKLCPIRYDMRSYWVNWQTAQASLATCQGRQLMTFNVPEYYAKYLGYPTASADLIYRKGKFWLHVVVNIPASEFAPNTDPQVIGVDLGLTRPAVTSRRKFLGGRHWKEISRRYFRLRRALQSKGTKSAKAHLKRLSGRLQRFRRDCDHVLSKRIIQSAIAGATIVIENLTEIRTTTNQKGRESRRRLHSWSFAQVRAFLEYKAEGAGMRVVAIDPRHTSQICSRCGYQSRSNRRSQSGFLCKECAYSLNADLNAAYNIRDKYHATLGIALGSGPQSIGLSHQLTSCEVG